MANAFSYRDEKGQARQFEGLAAAIGDDTAELCLSGTVGKHLHWKRVTVTPLGVLFNSDHDVTVAFDQDFLGEDTIWGPSMR